ncbi:troponin I, fast skeletal muscle-like [Thalassophryne amazonica]|uniref:troponin I, fast skeletal muscle-like n=1 Tax=Thalassophryne amazonica TaxID=390379 RepID=UPI00147218A0|nr:troponin I, fast skeletal muscle-like [Thalassophryne amazonica]
MSTFHLLQQTDGNIGDILKDQLSAWRVRPTRNSVTSSTRCTLQEATIWRQRRDCPRDANIPSKAPYWQVAMGMLEAEAKMKVDEREKFLAEKCPPLELPLSKEELEELCKKLHEQIDVSEEERYCIEFKLNLVQNEVRDLNIKIVDLRGKFKRPRLKKVRMSADAMLKALLGSKHTVNMDLRANLKQVKKEVKEEDKQLRDVGDWRKNIEDKSDRKKMFDS